MKSMNLILCQAKKKGTTIINKNYSHDKEEKLLQNHDDIYMTMKRS